MASAASDTSLAKARTLHESAIVIDGLAYYYDGQTERLDPKRVTALNITACETYNGFSAAMAEIVGVTKLIETDPVSTLIRSAADIEQAKRDGKVGIIVGVQASYMIGTDLWKLKALHDIGLRIFQLTYNDRCYTGDGCLEPVDGGLTRFGKQVMDEAAQLGMAIDLSHVGRRTSMEAIEAAPTPPMFSHANPNALTENPRNLTDEQIRMIGEAGGLIGICTWAPLCWKNRPGDPPSVDDVVDHIDYVVQMIGIDRVGIATDSGCTMNQAWLKQHSIEFNTAFPEIAGDYINNVGPDTHPEGLPDLTSLVLVTDALQRRGYGDDDVRKVIGGNFLRHLRAAWGG